MILLFKNEASGNHFLVNHKDSKVVKLNLSAADVFIDYADFIGGVDIISLPNLPTVRKFRKVVETGLLTNVPDDQLKATIYENYPEYFI